MACFIPSTPAVTVLNVRFNLPGDSNSYAAIDTGTTLVGGPPTDIQTIFSQIPGSAPGVGDLDGYYTYRV